MITIKKSSWHYKLIWRFYSKMPPENLCNYFWILVWIILKGIILLSLALLLLYVLIIGAFAKHSSILFFLFKAFWFSIAIISFILLVGYAGNELEIYYRDREPKEKKPNLIKEYWKAFKGKYCPKITFIK